MLGYQLKYNIFVSAYESTLKILNSKLLLQFEHDIHKKNTLITTIF